MKNKTVEKYYPLVISSIFTLLIAINAEVTSISNKLEKILEAVITFSSILIGFLAAMLGIIFSIKDTEIIYSILNYDDTKDTFVTYFRKPIISGFLTVIISALLFLDDSIPNIKLEQINLEIITIKSLFVLWMFILIYFILSSFRIIDILMIIILDKSNETYKELEGEKLDEDSVRKLKRELKK